LNSLMLLGPWSPLKKSQAMRGFLPILSSIWNGWKNDIDLGFDELILHNVNTAQEQFIDDFGEKVLPVLAKP
jgi:hypothetical protein